MVRARRLRCAEWGEQGQGRGGQEGGARREVARELRQRMTVAERVLWGLLRDHGLGLQCRRQALLAGWIPDFVIPSARLVIELDGGIHDAQPEHDEARTQELEARGYRVVRFRNEEVLERPREVLAAISQAAR